MRTKLNPKKIKKYLQNPAEVIVFDEIDSTNNEAKRRLTSAPSAPLLYCANSQTAGRGRKGHSFYSPSDTGLYLSLVLPIAGQMSDIQTITCAAAVATAGAIESLCPVTARIKWVNDIYVNGAKVCGILTELLVDKDNRPAAVCVGIGVNLTTEVFPEDIRDIAGSIGTADRNRLCAEITDRLIFQYAHLSQRLFLTDYTDRSMVHGREVLYTDKDGEHRATATGIDRDGGLIVNENGTLSTLRSGEISVKLSDSISPSFK